MNHLLDVQNETPIPFTEVPDYLPKRNGKKTHYATVYRWSQKGARGRILESTLIGGVRYTTREALFRFINGKTPVVCRSDYDVSVDRILTNKGK